jgi:cell division protein FtsW (lipid II flippase)
LVEKRTQKGNFSSILSIESLGGASAADREDIERLAAKKDWKRLREVALDGRIPDSARPGLIGGIVRSVRSTETRASGLYPSVDLRVRAAQALPEPLIDLRRSPREILTVFLQNEAIVDRIIQFRTAEDRWGGSENLQMSDIPSVPKAKVMLRTKDEALGLFWATIWALIGGILLLHMYLKRRRSNADEFLLPLMGSLGVLAVIMLFSVSSPLRVTAAIPGIPLLFGRAQPKYIGQALAVFLGLITLPFAYRFIRFAERAASQEVIALAAVAPLAANVFARWGAASIPAILILGGLIAAALHRIDRRAMSRFVLLATCIIATLAMGRALVGKSGYAPFIEFGKLALIIYTAKLCAEHDFFFGGKLRSLPSSAVVQFVSVWAVALTLTMLARDMGVLLLLWAPAVLLLGFAFSKREVLAGVVLLLIGAGIVYTLAFGPFPDRVAMWRNPWRYTPVAGRDYSGQMAQSIQRIASVPSPVAGLGLGKGTSVDVATDMQDLVLPHYFEQLGFVGLGLVIILYLVIIQRLFRISLASRDRFSHWLGLGVASAFGVQSVYIFGANFGAWPLTGVTMAPLAFGKAACLTGFVMVWTVLGISETSQSVAAGHVPEKRKKTVQWVYAGMAVLMLVVVGKVVKIAVIDRDANATSRYGPLDAMNPRMAAKLATLPRGRILARARSADFDDAKVLAQSNESGSGRVYSLGPAAWPVIGVSCPYGITGGELDWRSRLTGAYSLIQNGPVIGTPDKVLETALLSQWRAEHHPLWKAKSPWADKLAPADVQTTIVSSLQLEAYRRLSDYLSGSLYRNGRRPRKGAILIADVRTGEYLAKVQFPSVDPNSVSSGFMAWDTFATDPSGYLDPNGQIIDLIENTDRAPGSTAKLNTIMALLSAGEGKRRFWCGPGVKVNHHVIHDFNNGSHGWVDASEIIKYSCNRGAAQAAEVVGSKRLLSLYREKLRYRLPHMKSPENVFKENYDKIAFGQVMSASLNELMVTTCAIARGGEAIELHVLQKHSEDVERWRVCSKGSAAVLKKYMLSVAKPGGTAYSVYQGKVAWPSKTGSAEVAGAKKTDAWFVGFAPAESPRVAFVLWVEEDGTGSNMAKQIGLVPLIKQALSVSHE